MIGNCDYRYFYKVTTQNGLWLLGLRILQLLSATIIKVYKQSMHHFQHLISTQRNMKNPSYCKHD